MMLFGIVVAGAGAAVGVVGGLLGFQLFNRLSKTSVSDRQISSYRPWQRSLIIGFLTSVVTQLAFSFSDGDVNIAFVGLISLGVAFVCTALYVTGSLTLFTRFGPAILEAGELSLVVTITLTAILAFCGVLWGTLVVLGGFVLIAITVLNGIWIYRLR